ncbi:uncharacterized protein LOC119586014 [Penaeus monodon]|uniref:uncharacterized protein LOC119586014 n=1 Tax=Penaeus monodon TaxID=6687 RepID=UPI0018A7A276|nr:uncharacterized protein LOC119586014 [Penaeus monodon]
MLSRQKHETPVKLHSSTRMQALPYCQAAPAAPGAGAVSPREVDRRRRILTSETSEICAAWRRCESVRGGLSVTYRSSPLHHHLLVGQGVPGAQDHRLVPPVKGEKAGVNEHTRARCALRRPELTTRLFPFDRWYEAVILRTGNALAYKQVVVSGEDLYVTETPPRTLSHLLHAAQISDVSLVHDLPEFLRGGVRDQTTHVIVRFRSSRRSSLAKAKVRRSTVEEPR